ncbi:MAG: hypothetical protein KatS3mg052_2887 [Candidatus Roseilinea sp.]|nr:MAG: hypothetical protein KatS3mg052_2887 [Candidatus Roseilinea sp.]
MGAAVRSTYTSEVPAGIGSFGGLFDALPLRDMRAPVWVASTDGVSAKVELAAAFGRYASIGHDIVNHCINDILIQGVRPLFFLDPIAAAKLGPSQVAAVVSGMAEPCHLVGCALLGGETAEMSGVYVEGAFDGAGTTVGVVERETFLLRRSEIAAGDVLIGPASSGPRANGYSLIRKVLADRLALVQPDDPPVQALLAPHHGYLALVERAHITGGGFVENTPRVLPPGLRAAMADAALLRAHSVGGPRQRPRGAACVQRRRWHGHDRCAGTCQCHSGGVGRAVLGDRARGPR